MHELLWTDAGMRFCWMTQLGSHLRLEGAQVRRHSLHSSERTSPAPAAASLSGSLPQSQCHHSTR